MPTYQINAIETRNHDPIQQVISLGKFEKVSALFVNKKEIFIK